MKPYIVTKGKSFIYEMIFDLPAYVLLVCLVIMLVDPSSRRSGGIYFNAFIMYPLYLIYKFYIFYSKPAVERDIETLYIDSKEVVITGVENNLALEWKKIKKVEIINGLTTTTKLVFHLGWKDEEIELYGYQSTFKLKKALKYYGKGIEVVEPKKKWKLIYIPFW